MTGYLERKAALLRLADGPSADEVERLRSAAVCEPRVPRFSAALRAGPNVAVIAEFKRRSPTAGALPHAGEPAGAVALYQEHGAAAVSVLTDREDFGGSLDDLAVAASASPLPVFRKDFITTEAELYRARSAGASAALLIVAMLDSARLRALMAAAVAVGLESLVEVHTAPELETAAEAGATLIGINNRDLRTLTTDLAVSERLAPLAPVGSTIVAESGIRTRDDVRRLRDAGCHAVLVGESLMRDDPDARAARLRELASVPRRPA